MSKGTYSATEFQAWFSGSQRDELKGDELVVGVDVGKIAFYASLRTDPVGPNAILYFERDEIPEFLDRLGSLGFPKTTLVLEPTGTYGDALIHQAREMGCEVMRINGDQVSGARRAFDGVDSQHDGKSADLLSMLYFFDVSRPWRCFDPERGKLRAMYDLDRLIDRDRQVYVGRLEGVLARCWPEATNYLELQSAVLLELLKKYGGPQQIAEDAEAAARFMRKISGSLADEKIAAVIASAKTTIGCPMSEEECELMKYVAKMLRASLREARHVRREQEKIAKKHEYTRDLASFVGPRTALVIVAMVGPLTNYDSPKQLEKAMGLMLRGKSSGLTAEARRNNPEKVRISKRGPGAVRGYLFWVALRLLRKDAKHSCEIARAWYELRLKRNGDCGKKGITALMRKLVSAMWWVARGEEYDGAKLFDVQHLKRAGYLSHL